MFGQIKDIAEGWTNYALNREGELSETRMKICRECPLYNPENDKCDSKKWYNPETGEVSLVMNQGWISGCGCVMGAKSRVLNAKCVLGKWDK